MTRRARLMLSAGVFVATFAFRYLSLGSFENDHFVHLARAQQMLLGDLPVRDFVDPGMPLTYAASAAAQLLLGRSLFAEAVLTIGMLSLAAALTWALALRASGSVAVALLVTTLQVAIHPRLYNYPKILLYVVAIAAFWTYARRPAFSRLVLTAGCAAVAFLYRHDHGLYIAVATFALLASVHCTEGVGTLARRLGSYGAIVGLLLAPFAIYVQASLGLGRYVRSAIEFSRAESARTEHRWPRFRAGGAGSLPTEAPRPGSAPRVRVQWVERVPDATRMQLERRYRLDRAEFSDGQTWTYDLLDASWPNVSALVRDPHVQDTQGIDRERAFGPERWPLASAENLAAALYYLVVSVPVLASALLVVRGRRGCARTGPTAVPVPVIVATIVLLGEVDAGFLRDQVAARLADVFGPAAVLGAWLIAQARQPGVRLPAGTARAGAWVGRAFAAAVLAVAIPAAALLGDFRHQVFETHVFTGPAGMLRYAVSLTSTLREWPWGDHHPFPEYLPLARYVRACTVPRDRVLATWFTPELYFFSMRGFAGGQAFFLYGFNISVAEQELIVSRLQREPVPLVFVKSSEAAGFAQQWPLIERYVAAHYRPAGGFEPVNGVRVDVLSRVDRAPTSTFAELGLPCYP